MKIRYPDSLIPDGIASERINLHGNSFVLHVHGSSREEGGHDRDISVYFSIKSCSDPEKMSCLAFTVLIEHPTDSSKSLPGSSRFVKLHHSRFDDVNVGLGWSNFANLTDLKSKGFLDDQNNLVVSVSFRPVPLALHIYTDESFMQHDGFGLGSAHVKVDVLMCFTVTQMRDAIISKFPQLEATSTFDLWWFIVGDTLRPRKLVPFDDPNFIPRVSGIPRLDAFYLDTFSIAHLYLDPICEGSFVFIKVLDRQTGKLHSVARLSLAKYSSPAAVFDYLSAVNPGVPRWLAVKENLPNISAGDALPYEGELVQSDILICAEWYEHEPTEAWIRDVGQHLRQQLKQRWDQATALLNQPLRHLTLIDILEVGRSFDFHSLQTIRAFHRRKKDARLALVYMMESRHLWYYCDICGAFDFQGIRYQCTVCDDFDMCENCYDSSHGNLRRDDDDMEKYISEDGHRLDHVMTPNPPLLL
ncbi:hypothetical protein Ae201684_008994 [Aphanomyces euteiches]|uniref:ZZ-type domain-containing protein n=1 Tax=Aphanomyces euteiches TaxID=100861 RepID=A0A6G0X2J5_9STRA|nr:hypothetical protein Ae201684_008993 [Aphanomyces euteiches]KAF0734125.1 hypothetical protein Ae201684_008994 [Aphanomyces euteiches]